MSEQRFAEDGFEYEGTFYAWHVSDMGKDLMLIDRFSGLAIDAFFEVVDDPHERFRAPILLSMIACSIRHGHPDWSVERITRAVMDLELSAVTFIAAEDDDDETSSDGPLDDSEHRATSEPRDERSSLRRIDSSPSSTPRDDSDSPTSYAIPS